MTGRLASERLRRLVRERSHADQTAVTLESVPFAEAARPRAAEVTGRVEQAARHLADRPDVDPVGDELTRAVAAIGRVTHPAGRRGGVAH